MIYAIIGDLHSDYKRTKYVKKFIKKNYPLAKTMGLGDLYECKIGKKKAKKVSNATLDEAAIMTDQFNKLIDFPSIFGNQELRIQQVTGRSLFEKLPEKMEIDGATLIHGHQFEWADDFSQIYDSSLPNLLFFGHSHYSGLFVNGEKKPFSFNKKIQLQNAQYSINVGSIVDHSEWCLYDSSKKTIMFMKTEEN